MRRKRAIFAKLMTSLLNKPLSDIHSFKVETHPIKATAWFIFGFNEQISHKIQIFNYTVNEISFLIVNFYSS